MGQVYEAITPKLKGFIEQQKMFFVATAPLASDGLVNCSPKGMDSFRVLGPNEVAYMDYCGSGVETISHLRENGRIVIMFCAFDGPPNILRLHGEGESFTAGSAEFKSLASHFDDIAGQRAIIRVQVSRVGDSCGYAVPRYDYVGERDTLVRWAESKGPDGLKTYEAENNATSLDGLPGIDP